MSAGFRRGFSGVDPLHESDQFGLAANLGLGENRLQMVTCRARGDPEPVGSQSEIAPRSEMGRDSSLRRGEPEQPLQDVPGRRAGFGEFSHQQEAPRAAEAIRQKAGSRISLDEQLAALAVKHDRVERE